MLSRKTRSSSHGQDSHYYLGWQEYEKNPYHAALNPSGIIQMGLAENQLSVDLIESWLAKNQEALTFKSSGVSNFRELALFQDYNGLPAFKNALVDFMAEIRGNRVRFDPNKLVLTAGSTSANEILMFCIVDPGEAILVPTPYYPGFDRDLKWRTEVNIVPIHCHSWNGFKITKTALEEAYTRAQRLGFKVKGVVITNPSNPLGTTATREELHLLLSFVAAKQIHLVSDEIFSGTVFDTPEFVSVLEAVLELGLGGTEVWNRTHIVYSLSKDLGIPGFRVGMVYSNNDIVVSAATKMSSFGLVSSQTQSLLANMLSDAKFTRSYISENHNRLRQRQRRLVSGLRNLGIKCLKGNAGLFCWVDMRSLLRRNTFEAEMELWKKIVGQVKINVCPGSSCHCSEPGWFRLCFANMSDDSLDLVMGRIKAFTEASPIMARRRTNGTSSVHEQWMEPLNCTKWLPRLASVDPEPDR